MKASKIIQSILLILTIVLFASCSKTKDIAQKEESKTVTLPPPPPKDYKINVPQSDGLNSVDIQQINDYATRKANLVCKLERYQNESELDESQVADIKERIIKIDEQLKQLMKEIDTFLNTHEKQRYYRKAYEQAYAKCN